MGYKKAMHIMTTAAVGLPLLLVSPSLAQREPHDSLLVRLAQNGIHGMPGPTDYTLMSGDTTIQMGFDGQHSTVFYGGNFRGMVLDTAWFMQYATMYPQPVGYSGLTTVRGAVARAEMGGPLAIEPQMDQQWYADGRFERVVTAMTDTLAGLSVKPRLEPATQYQFTPYPNPFNPTVTVPFEAKLPGTYEFEVINILGQVVQKNTETLTPGLHTFHFNGDSYPTGIYVFHLSGQGVDVKAKGVLQK
jgi:hypothetical protein